MSNREKLRAYRRVMESVLRDLKKTIKERQREVAKYDVLLANTESPGTRQGYSTLRNQLLDRISKAEQRRMILRSLLFVAEGNVKVPRKYKGYCSFGCEDVVINVLSWV